MMLAHVHSLAAFEEAALCRQHNHAAEFTRCEIAAREDACR